MLDENSKTLICLVFLRFHYNKLLPMDKVNSHLFRTVDMLMEKSSVFLGI